ncbi:hypothetical protein AXF14_01365 [Actinomyces radicidentis]|uniref:Uncharacterized protein n=1 Tax=Actinomyces radicidentis TaxID=111015 RepID=A0A0X8JCR6_ACTRD|nr:hypothetical protein AXF14_01365 [Actinomyces radicidentis]
MRLADLVDCPDVGFESEDLVDVGSDDGEFACVEELLGFIEIFRELDQMLGNEVNGRHEE